MQNVDQIDKMMTVIQKGAIRFHGSSLAFIYEDDFVYISAPLQRLAMNGMPVNLKEDEFQQVMQFIYDEVLGGFREI